MKRYVSPDDVAEIRRTSEPPPPCGLSLIGDDEDTLVDVFPLSNEELVAALLAETSDFEAYRS